MTRYVELRRHTDNDGDRLTPREVADAEAIAGRLSPPYVAFVSTGASRCTQMLEILRSAAGHDDVPITEASGLHSSVEDRWRDAAKAAGKGADVVAQLQGDLAEEKYAHGNRFGLGNFGGARRYPRRRHRLASASLSATWRGPGRRP
jgi:hypothetical protein